MGTDEADYYEGKERYASSYQTWVLPSVAGYLANNYSLDYPFLL